MVFDEAIFREKRKDFLKRFGPSERRQQQLEAAVQRKFGYGKEEAWKKLKADEQNRIKSWSEKLLEHFRPIHWFQLVLGRFPFVTKKLEDGSFTYTQSPWSLSYIYYVITSVLIVVTFFLFTVGGILTFLDFHPEHTYHDRCGNSWGNTVLSRNMPAVIFVWGEMMISTAGSIYVLLNGRNFLRFYNIVNEATMQLDVDPTTNIHWTNLRGAIVFSILFVAYVILFVTGGLHSLQETSAFVSHALFYFFSSNLYLIGSDSPFTAEAYEDVAGKCNTTCANCYQSEADIDKCHEGGCFNEFNHQSFSFQVIKYIGFFVICYTLLCARALIQQLEFFCHVLVNLASTWNKRFLIYASEHRDKGKNPADPYQRRLKDNEVLEDHYKIVLLYNEVETNFSFIIFFYYTAVFFNLICEIYYFALLSTQVTCGTAVGRERDAALNGLCYTNEELGINNTFDVLNSGFSSNESTTVVVAFEDPCSMKQKTIIMHASITTVVLLIMTLTSFIITTLIADNASHQADVGFYRVRKRGYMACKTKQARNAMHSLVFSFTGPKPFIITAAGFFPVKKSTLVVVVAVAFVYFLIIMGFKPGQITGDVRCFQVNNDSEMRFVVHYPRVI